MAVRLEHIDLLVPVRVLAEKYPGGLAQCLLDHQPLLGRRMWHDDHLLRDGALDPAHAKALVEGWQSIGLEPLHRVDGILHWKDLCVVDTAAHGPTAVCDWLEWDPHARVAWLKGFDPGEPVGPAAR